MRAYVQYIFLEMMLRQNRKITVGEAARRLNKLKERLDG